MLILQAALAAEPDRYVILGAQATLHPAPDAPAAFRREGAAHAVAVRVVAEKPGWVRVSTARVDDLCVPGLSVLTPWELLVWVPETALLPTVSRRVDVSGVQVYPGAPVGPEGAGLRSFRAAVPIPADAVTTVFPPAGAIEAG